MVWYGMLYIRSVSAWCLLLLLLCPGYLEICKIVRKQQLRIAQSLNNNNNNTHTIHTYTNNDQRTCTNACMPMPMQRTAKTHLIWLYTQNIFICVMCIDVCKKKKRTLLLTFLLRAAQRERVRAWTTEKKKEMIGEDTSFEARTHAPQEK